MGPGSAGFKAGPGLAARFASRRPAPV